MSVCPVPRVFELSPDLQLFKDAWLLHMRSDRPWAWQPLKVENEDHGAPELWCHPACKVNGREGQKESLVNP